MLSVHDLPGLHSFGHLLTLIFICIGMAAAIYGFFSDLRMQREEREERNSAKRDLLPPPAPAFGAPRTETTSPATQRVSESPVDRGAIASSRMEPVKAVPASEGNQPRQADLADALLEHLEAQGYEFDPGPSPGR